MKMLAPLVVALCSIPFAGCRSTPEETSPPAVISSGPTPANLTARSLTIVDDAGRPRLRMGVNSNVSPEIEFLDQAGESVARARMMDVHDDETGGRSSKQAFALTADVGESGHVGNFVVSEEGVALVMADADDQGWSLTLRKGVLTVGLSCKSPNGSMDGETIDLDVILGLEEGRLVLETPDGKLLGSFAVPTTHSRDSASSPGKMSVGTKP